ncbi:MAG: DUF4136 domain-containing protein [Marinomonas sp.]
MRTFSTKFLAIAAASTLGASLGGCATVAGPSPVEVTRFHDASGLAAGAQTGQERTVFIASAPTLGTENGGPDTAEMASFKRAVAAELAELGYREAPRRDAAYTAQVSLDRFTTGEDRPRRSPVSVGVGGSTGSYGSGVGLGIGINLGGNKSSVRLGTQLAVMLKDRANGQTVWEGRANWDVARESELAAPNANAPIIANALFSEFPGGNGETVEIRADQ